MPINLSTADRVLVLGHVDANHLLVIAKERLGHGLGELCFANASRSEKQEHAVRAIEPVLERPFVQHQPSRNGGNRLPLTDHAPLQPDIDALEAIGYVAEHHVLGNLRRVRDNRDDVCRPHFPSAIHLRSHGRGIKPADHLVGEMLMSRIPRRHLEGRLEGFIENANAIVTLQPRPQADEHAPSFLDSRLGHVDAPESAVRAHHPRACAPCTR